MGNAVGKVYLLSENVDSDDDLQRDIYFKPNLLGGSVEFDMDLSQVSCGCFT